MGFLSSLFSVKVADDPRLPSLVSLGFAYPEDVVKQYIKPLKSSDWRDWEGACKSVSHLRAENLIKYVLNGLYREEVSVSSSIPMIVIGTLFNIGGMGGLKELKKLTKYSDQRVLRCMERFNIIAEQAAGVLEELKEKSEITDTVKDFILTRRNKGLPGNWYDSDYDVLSLPDLWGVAACDPGCLPACVIKAQQKIAEKVLTHQDISPEDIYYGKAFASIGFSCDSLVGYLTSYYFGYYTDENGLKAAIYSFPKWSEISNG